MSLESAQSQIFLSSHWRISFQLHLAARQTAAADSGHFGSDYSLLTSASATGPSLR